MNSIEDDRRVIIGRGLPVTGTLQQPVSLPHPQKDTPTSYISAGCCLQEINWFKSQYSSWFNGNTVLSDGGMYLCSEVDPLFLALPFLEASRGSAGAGEGLFQDAEQIFQAAAVPGGASGGQALRAVAEQHLGLVCDAQEACGNTYYRLSERKVTAWLKCKTQRVVGCLAASGGAFAGMDRPALEGYVVGLLGEYLSPGMAATLRAALGQGSQEVPDAAEDAPLAEVTNKSTSWATQEDFKRAAKKPRVDPKVLARQKAQEAREEKQKAQIKRETAGMKTMSSFFSRK